MSLADKLRTILGIKAEVKQAIIDKGGTLEDTTPFGEYPAKILEIQGGGGQALTRKELMKRVYILKQER